MGWHDIGEFTSVDSCRNLYRIGAKYYKLFANGKTPNDCWLINPAMHGLSDIDVATASPIWNGDNVALGEGIVSAAREFIHQ